MAAKANGSHIAHALTCVETWLGCSLGGMNQLTHQVYVLHVTWWNEARWWKGTFIIHHIDLASYRGARPKTQESALGRCTLRKVPDWESVSKKGVLGTGGSMKVLFPLHTSNWKEGGKGRTRTLPKTLLLG